MKRSASNLIAPPTYASPIRLARGRRDTWPGDVPSMDIPEFDDVIEDLAQDMPPAKKQKGDSEETKIVDPIDESLTRAANVIAYKLRLPLLNLAEEATSLKATREAVDKAESTFKEAVQVSLLQVMKPLILDFVGEERKRCQQVKAIFIGHLEQTLQSVKEI